MGSAGWNRAEIEDHYNRDIIGFHTKPLALYENMVQIFKKKFTNNQSQFVVNTI